MKKIFWLSLFVLVLGTVVACSKEADEKIEEDEEVHAIEVDLTVTEKVDVNEKVSLKAVVTMNDEKIKDADNVVFEVWEEGKKDASEMIESVNGEDGTYTAETSFDADGMFHIQVHVDARGQHTMPKKVVTVGTGGNYEEDAEEGHSTDQHSNEFSMNFLNPETVQVKKETELMVDLELEGKALESVKVRYEIWDTNDEAKHDWVDTEETKPGTYTAQYAFEKAGTYHVEIHVQDEHDLHEHEAHEIIVE